VNGGIAPGGEASATPLSIVVAYGEICGCTCQTCIVGPVGDPPRGVVSAAYGSAGPLVLGWLNAVLMTVPGVGDSPVGFVGAPSGKLTSALDPLFMRT
jgi:hypothetical protein